METTKTEKYTIWRTENPETYLANFTRQNEKRKLKNLKLQISKLQSKLVILENSFNKAQDST